MQLNKKVAFFDNFYYQYLLLRGYSVVQFRRESESESESESDLGILFGPNCFNKTSEAWEGKSEFLQTLTRL